MRKEGKRNLRILILVLMLGVLSGCGVSVGDVSEHTLGNEKMTPTVTLEATPTATTAPTATPEPIPDAAFDEPFEIECGQTLTVGRPGISLYLNYAGHYDDYAYISYTLTVDGKTYEGNGECYEDGSRLIQYPFVKHVVRYVDCEDGKATLMLTENYELQKPLALSGNAEDRYVTEKPEYLESEHFVMFIDKGVEIPGNMLEQMESLVSLVEEETGFLFINDTGYGTKWNDVRHMLWGQDVFLGVDAEYKKLHIYVLPPEVWWPSSAGQFIVVGPEDIRFGEGEGEATVHELAHAAHQRNGVQMNRVIDEGFAMYIEGKICEKDEVIPFDYDVKEEYKKVYAEITADNAEKEFVNAAMDEYDYLYGYWFITYLTENYGEDIFQKLLEATNAEADEYQGEMSKEEMVPIVKKVTSESIFEEFGAWFEETAKDWPRAKIYRAE